MKGSSLKDESVFVRDMVCSPFLDGFSAVLNDGRAGRIIVKLLYECEGDENENVAPVRWHAKGVWAPDMNKATCTAVNFKYRMLAFGNDR